MDVQDLVTSARGGDRAAFGDLVRRFQDVAFGGAFACLGDAEEARDATQDAFIEAWEKLGSLREPAAFPGWFRRIVLKRADRHLRRRRPVTPEGVLEGLPSPLPDPLSLTEIGEVRDVVRTAIACLPEAQRLPLTLFHLDGYRQRDVAAFLELPVSTVKKRIFDARKALQEKVLHMVDESVDQARPSRDDSFARQVDFWLAVEARDVAGMERLIAADPSLLTCRSGWESAPGLRSAGWEVTATTWAAHMGHVDMLRMLLDRGAPVDQPGHNDDSLLHVAVMNAQIDAVELLIYRGASLNAFGSCQQTPLHRAVIRGEKRIAALLVDAGADLETQDHRSRTAADWAALKGRAGLLEWLLAQGAKPTQLAVRQPRRLRPTSPLSRKIPPGTAALGQWLDASRRHGADGPAATEVARAGATWHVPLVLETGVKAVDLVAPFARGGHVGIDAGLGNGKLLLTQQIARNVIESYDARVVYVDDHLGDPDPHLDEWCSFVADGKLVGANSTLVFTRQSDPQARVRAAETGLSLAEDLRRSGHDVLLLVDTPVALADGVLPMLRSQAGYQPDAAITICYLGQVPHSLDQPAFDFLDAVVRMDERRSRAGLFPAIDLAHSRSRLLTDDRLPLSHRTVVERADHCFRALGAHSLSGSGPVSTQLAHVAPDDQAVAEELFGRSRRLDLFLTQPYHGTELWIGEPGETVGMAETVEAARQIIDGEHDGVPAAAFQNVGTIDQALEKARRI